MLLPKEKIKHLNSITHEGKVVVFATDTDGQIWYTIKQDGFEDTYINKSPENRTGWEEWQTLPLPGWEELQENQAAFVDQSVLEREQAELTFPVRNEETGVEIPVGERKYFYRSRYDTHDQSAVAPVQLVSGLEHLYVFRQAKADADKVTPNSLLVDRFVLDGLTNQLTRKLEVRFKRSRQKYQPTETMQVKKGQGLTNVDSLDYRDADGKPFYEPTTELSLIGSLHKGWFAVVLVNKADTTRWHIFAYQDENKKVVLTALRASEEGLFTVKDYFLLESNGGDDNHPLPRNIPGIIQRILQLGHEINNGLAATKYDIQRERQTKEGMQLFRETSKVMLAIPTIDGVATLSFTIAKDGLLSQVDESGNSDVVWGNEREVMLPVNTLDEIKSIGLSTPLPKGTITAMVQGDEDEIKITFTNETNTPLHNNQQVKISGTQSYDGYYVVKQAEDDSFQVAATWVNDEMGRWEVIPKEEPKTVFRGQITAYEKTTDGLEVSAIQHGLKAQDEVEGDAPNEVQIVNTNPYNGLYSITDVQDDSFTLKDLRWPRDSEAVNLKLEARNKRRGIVFSGPEDYIKTPKLDLKRPSEDQNFGETYSAWVYLFGSQGKRVIMHQPGQELSVNEQNKIVLRVALTNGVQSIESSELAPVNQWMHCAGMVAYNKKNQETTLKLCINGIEDNSKSFPTAFPTKIFFGDIEPKIIDVPGDFLEQVQLGLKGDNVSGNKAVMGDYEADVNGVSKAGQIRIWQHQQDNWEEIEPLTIDGLRQEELFGWGVSIWNNTIITKTYPGNYYRNYTPKIFLFQWQDSERRWEKALEFPVDKGKIGRLTIKNGIAVAGIYELVNIVGYVFQRIGGKWQKVASLKVEGKTMNWDMSVAADGNTIVISDILETVDGVIQTGEVYIFQRQSDDSWKYTKTLNTKEYRGLFGCSMALWQNIVFIGASLLYTSEPGKVYIYQQQDGDWVPIGKITDNDSDGAFGTNLAIDGQRLIVKAHNSKKAFIYDLVKSQPEFTLGGTSESYQSFKLADVQIWDKARTTQNIKDSMYLHLTGHEPNLVGYWRLGGISAVDGNAKRHKVVDFSAYGHDGIVHGNCFVSEVTLHRNLKGYDGDDIKNESGQSIPATQYSNDELFAVSQRATYMESFQFKVNADGDMDPNNINGSKLFQFAYWGQRNRSSDTRIEHEKFSVDQGDFKKITANEDWYLATCSFTVPDGVSLVRSFEISQLQGDWNSLEIRQHQIKLVSDTVRKATYTDDIELETLADDKSTDFEDKLKLLAQEEQKEASLLKEKWWLEKRIDLLSDMAKLNQEIQRLTDKIALLIEEEGTLKKKYEEEQENPLNYWCKLVSRGKPTGGLRVFTGNTRLIDTPENDGIWVPSKKFTYGNIKFCFEKQEDGTYVIICRYYPTHRVLEICSNGSNICSIPKPTEPDHTYTDAQKWCIEKQLGGYYLIRHKTGRYMAVAVQSVDVILWEYFDGGLMQFDITSLSSYPTSWSSINEARQNWNNKLTELQKTQKEKAKLEGDKSNKENRITLLETRLNSTNNKLLTSLSSLNKDALGTIKAYQKTPQTMPQLHQDQRKLISKGALLSFVSPKSRLSAFETCEGNVQLSYFDKQGRLRQTHFDATADSRNPTFEQWIPDAGQHPALNLNQESHYITLQYQILLPEEWTIETWFFHPLPRPSSNDSVKPKDFVWLQKGWQNILAESQDKQDCQIVVKNGQLGAQINGLFFDSGYDLEHLEHGWHHLTAIGLGTQNQASTVFYIDGKKVGNTQNTPLKFDGHYVELPSHKNPTQAITVSVWAKSDTENWNASGCLVSKRSAYVLHPNENSKQIRFMIFVNGTQTDVSYELPANITTWHHYAGTFDGKNLRLYVDGHQVNSTEKSGQIDEDEGPLYIGIDDGFDDRLFQGSITGFSVLDKALTEGEIKAEYDKGWQNCQLGLPAKSQRDIKTVGKQFGRLTELRIWNVALKEPEIDANSKTLLTGYEPGLQAYYPMTEASGTTVRDHSTNNNPGTISGKNWWACTAPIGNTGHEVLMFDGQDDYVEINHHNDFNLQNNFTIEAWVKTRKLEGNQRIFSKLGAYEFGLLDKKIQYIAYPDEPNGYKAEYSISTTKLSIGTWNHLAVVRHTNNTTKFYVNGELLGSKSGTYSPKSNNTKCFIGGLIENNKSELWEGQIADVCVWNKSRDETEIKADMNERLTGKEDGLVGYWPLHHIILQNGQSKVFALTSQNHHGTVHGDTFTSPDTYLPIVGEAVISDEYSTIGIEPNSGRKAAMMRRFFAYPVSNGVELLYDKRIEELELKWIGNAQSDPTLLGYIEGPPPIPSENLTVEDDYNGATSVELTMSEDMTLSWQQVRESGDGMKLDVFLGAALEFSTVSGPGIGINLENKVGEFKVGVRGEWENMTVHQYQSNVETGSSLNTSDRLELRGEKEPEAQFSHLGQRFTPKNVGYALVISSMDDMFITRLKRSKKMVSYHTQPVNDIPPDINTITFMINPTYTMNGSLDGLVGSNAADERFFRHVPEMRTQFGSLYPASYYRLQEAYDLKEKIKQADKNREAYFNQFKLSNIEFIKPQDADQAPAPITFERAEDKPSDEQKSTQEEKQQKLQADTNNKLEDIKSDLQTRADRRKEEAEKKKAEIEARIKDREARVHALSCFEEWQKKMENIETRAGKRNIVNTYVWDANGGLFVESEGFANTVEHSLGVVSEDNWALGAQGEIAVGFAADLTALYAARSTQTISKTNTKSKGFQLNVNLDGIEHRGVTNQQGRPLLPGEKVGRYRFMTFYLEGSQQNFHDFFDYVVDPEWLQSNSENARALRQVDVSQPTKTWRVLHRVTYVERPALKNFGQDIRPLEGEEDDTALTSFFDYLKESENNYETLKEKHELLDIKLDLIFTLLEDIKKSKRTVASVEQPARQEYSPERGPEELVEPLPKGDMDTALKSLAHFLNSWRGKNAVLFEMYPHIFEITKQVIDEVKFYLGYDVELPLEHEQPLEGDERSHGDTAALRSLLQFLEKWGQNNSEVFSEINLATVNLMGHLFIQIQQDLGVVDVLIFPPLINHIALKGAS